MSTTKNSTQVSTAEPTLDKSPLHRSIEHTIAMQASAALCTFFFYPIDSVKYRIMSQDGSTKYNYHKTGKDFSGLYRGFRDTYRYEGISALYRGVGLAMFASVISWGIYMIVYKYLLFFYNKHSIGNSIVFDYGASLIASMLCALFTNPIWLIKTRMQLQDRTATDVVYYKSFIHGGRVIVRTEGFLALFRGLVPQMLLSLPNALYIPMYELFKRSFVQIASPHSDRHCNMWEIFICSCIAKTIITVLSNPLLVIKTKMQDHRNSKEAHSSQIRYTGFRSAIAEAISREGVMKGLVLRGLGIGLAQKILRSTTHLVIYELFLRAMKA
ncbi:mitochondrial carrier protein [Perkinsela sp. CCAP 1560/4]|nr:mitochondrial carrier protein [Perkinsela sp. CCAP 1560/4]|eukprot:KNH08035.1 mitochondrial carrier protein [Perkinsela sp. CCAP 1560/4]